MRKSIERVIAELEVSRGNCCIIYNFDKADAYESAINLIKEVLATETNQIRSKENDN